MRPPFRNENDCCPVCDSTDWAPKGNENDDEEWWTGPFPCNSCGYPLLLNEYEDEDSWEVKVELAAPDDDHRVLAWAREMHPSRRNCNSTSGRVDLPEPPTVPDLPTGVRKFQEMSLSDLEVMFWRGIRDADRARDAEQKLNSISQLIAVRGSDDPSSLVPAISEILKGDPEILRFLPRSWRS